MKDNYSLAVGCIVRKGDEFFERIIVILLA